MSKFNLIRARVTIRKILFLTCFLVFLYPISGFEGLSINYSFVLFAVVISLWRGRVIKPHNDMLLAMGIFTTIFFVAAAYQVELFSAVDRRLVSFVVFMTSFAFVVVRIDPQMVASFKLSIVLISVYFSLDALVTFLVTNASTPVGYEAKDLVGSQRYGFVYILALWIVLFWRATSLTSTLGKYLLVCALIAGLLLTFSRSSVVALIVSIGVYALTSVWRWTTRPTFSAVSKGGAIVIVAVSLGFIIFKFLPLTITFFGDRLFGLLNSESLATHLNDSQTSEGTRVYIIRRIFEFVLANPLTGSGFLGVWVLPDAPAGSAHNQYVDVLFRTGLIGAVIYAFLLFRLAKQLYRYERALFWGLIGMLVYGLFHETFKESHGGFIFAFILGLAESLRRMTRTQAASTSASSFVRSR